MASGGSKKVDIQSVIEDWAKQYFQDNGTKKERKLFSDQNVAMEIDWKRIKFVHDTADYEPKPPVPGTGTPTNHILFNASYTNRTDQKQTYTFRTERTTRSSCYIEVEQGYVTGVEMNVKLTTPCEILEVNAGFKREMTLSNSEGQTIEEELTWGVDSQVDVDPHHTGEAKLIIVEEEYKGGFAVKTHITGKARVVFTNLKNNNAFMKAIERPVVDIVKEAIREKWIPATEALSVDDATKSVVCKTKGKCHFKFGIKQIIEVDQKPIS